MQHRPGMAVAVNSLARKKSGKKKSGDEYAKNSSGASNIPKVVRTDEELNVHTGKANGLDDVFLHLQGRRYFIGRTKLKYSDIDHVKRGGTLWNEWWAWAMANPFMAMLVLVADHERRSPRQRSRWADAVL